LTLVQTQRIPELHRNDFGSKHCRGLIQWMKMTLETTNYIGSEDLSLFRITDDPAEAVNIIRDYERHVGPPEIVPKAFA